MTDACLDGFNGTIFCYGQVSDEGPVAVLVRGLLGCLMNRCGAAVPCAKSSKPGDYSRLPKIETSAVDTYLLS